MKLIAYILVILLTISASSLIYGEAPHKNDNHKEHTGVNALSGEVRELLKKEMVAIQEGMMSIVPAYASGNWGEIAIIGKKIKDSYLIKQNLTDKQMEELHSSLSESFKEMDRNFHYLAGMLSHAAENKKAELVGFYFSELNRSCVSCHAKHTPHKFPLLKSTEAPAEHSH